MPKFNNYPAKEEKYKDAFKYFDKDGDGVITQVELDQILSAMGNKLTKIEMDRLLFCLNPESITERDFLNVMASSLVKEHKLPATMIYDAFQLYNAAKHNKPSNTSLGHLQVMDNDLIMREDFTKFITEFMKPLNVTTQPLVIKQQEPVRPKYKYKVDLAFIAPNIFMQIPVDAEDCYEVHRVDYSRWLKKCEVRVNERDRRREMIQAFRIYNTVYGMHKGKTSILGELEVQDDDLILKSDLRKIMLRLGEKLSEKEIVHFMKKAENYADPVDSNYINYVRMCKSHA